MTNLVNMSEYIAWADRKLCDVVKELNDQEFQQELEGAKRSVRELITHWIVYYAIYNGRKEKGQTEQVFNDLKSNMGAMNMAHLLDFWIENAEEFSSQLKENDKDTFTIKFGEKSFEIPDIDYFMQITDHATYHRGQLMTFLKILGKDGINTDYYSFIIDKYSKL